MRRTGNSSALKRVLLYTVAALVFSGAVVGSLYLIDNVLPGFGGIAEIKVGEETTPEEMISQIKAQTDIRFERSLRRVFEKKKVAEYISCGHYIILPEYTHVYVARMLNNKWQTPVKMVLSGNLRTKDEIASKIGRQMSVDSSEVRRALDDSSFLSRFDTDPGNVYGLFVPNTYEMYWDASLTEIFARMKKASDNIWTEERLAKAESLRLSRNQVVVLASIVNSESNYVPEYPRIAGVYLTRYRKGMKLQADPTVAFCYDYSLSRILNRHLQYDSPYNTYRYKGLPPGPICCPTLAAIDGVLNADIKSGNMFFCASPEFDGTHRFARTFSEHSANAKAFRDALDNRNKS